MRREETESGFSLIELLIVVAIVGIISAIAVPNLLASRRAANEAAAIQSMRVISSAQGTYFATNGGGTYATAGQLYNASLIDQALYRATTGVLRNGYAFDTNPRAVGGNPATGYVSGASPASFIQGTRQFTSDESGVIYVQDGTGAVPTTVGGVPVGN